MNFETNIAIIGLLTSLTSIVIAFLSFKRNEKQDQRKEGKNEGLILTNISYIKTMVERMEDNLIKLDERYRNVLERLSKVEASLLNVIKRVDESNKIKGG